MVGVVVVVLLAWLVADWLAHREWLGGPDARIPVVAAAPLLGAILASSGLGGADEELDRTGAVPWRLIRALHVLAAFVLVSGALAVTGLWEPRTYGAFELVRNTAGYFGLVAGAATDRSAAGAGASVRVRRGRPHRRAETAACRHRVVDLALQPWTTTQATWIAVALFVAGAVLYARFGPRLPRPPEHSSG